MNILVTNDDGPGAAGLIALFNAAANFGRPVVVVPRVQHSSKGHAVTAGPIDIECCHDPRLQRVFVCAGTPADCVRLALLHLDIGPVGLVLAGINHGANAGVDVYYSGTVAAAREAALLGTPGVAVSQLMRPQWSDNWDRAQRFAEQALGAILGEQGPGHPLLNINLPDPPTGGSPRGICYCPLTREPLTAAYSAPPDPSATRYQTDYTGRYFDRPAPSGFDFHALTHDWITITPLLSDLSDPAALARMNPR